MVRRVGVCICMCACVRALTLDCRNIEVLLVKVPALMEVNKG